MKTNFFILFLLLFTTQLIYSKDEAHPKSHKTFLKNGKSTEPLQPITGKVKNEQEQQPSSQSYQSGEWENTEMCDTSDNFKCQCRKGCKMEIQTVGSMENNACVCFEEKMCVEKNQQTNQWEQTEKDSYKKQWSEVIEKCKPQKPKK